MESNHARFPFNPRADLGVAPRLVEVIEDHGGTRYVWEFPNPPPRVTVDHEEGRRFFLATEPDGETAVCPDEPVVSLVVELESDTGERDPAMNDGQPTYRYLWLEEKWEWE